MNEVLPIGERGAEEEEVREAGDRRRLEGPRTLRQLGSRVCPPLPCDTRGRAHCGSGTRSRERYVELPLDPVGRFDPFLGIRSIGSVIRYAFGFLQRLEVPLVRDQALAHHS